MTSHEDPRADVANQELEKDNNEAFNKSEVSERISEFGNILECSFMTVL